MGYFYPHLIGEKTNLRLSDLLSLPQLLVVEQTKRRISRSKEQSTVSNDVEKKLFTGFSN